MASGLVNRLKRMSPLSFWCLTLFLLALLSIGGIALLRIYYDTSLRQAQARQLEGRRLEDVLAEFGSGGLTRSANEFNEVYEKNSAEFRSGEIPRARSGYVLQYDVKLTVYLFYIEDSIVVRVVVFRT